MDQDPQPPLFPWATLLLKYRQSHSWRIMFSKLTLPAERTLIGIFNIQQTLREFQSQKLNVFLNR